MVEKHLKPAPGREVPMEDGRPWPEDGATVEVSRYVRRRIADGDLIEAGSVAKATVILPIVPGDPPANPPGDGKGTGIKPGRNGDK